MKPLLQRRSQLGLFNTLLQETKLDKQERYENLIFPVKCPDIPKLMAKVLFFLRVNNSEVLK